MHISKIIFSIIFILSSWTLVRGQAGTIEIKKKKFHTLDKTIIEGELGYLTVPENRENPDSRKIKVKFIRLKSLAQNPKEPVVYLEGGGSACTWQAEKPKYLNDWLPILQVSDLIFVDQRGTTDRKLIYVRKDEYPEEFLVSAQVALEDYQSLCTKALQSFQQKGIDVQGYGVAAHAKDIIELTQGLGIDRYSIFGFSYGTHIGMALIKLHEKSIANAVLAGADGLDQSFNYPSHLDNQFERVAKLADQDTLINRTIPSLKLLLNRVMDKLEREPMEVSVKHPLTKKSIAVKIGPFGLALILRLDIDDSNDIPVIPRLLYSIDQGDKAMLQWFVQKRIAFTLAVPGNGINQGIASWASAERWAQIEREAKESTFGNVVNFPFYEASEVWPRKQLKIDTSVPLKSEVRTLFISGDLDGRTPVSQVNEISEGFSNSTHLIAKNAGHEQAMWYAEIFDEAIPQFLVGKDVSHFNATRKIKFIPLQGPSDRHPSIGH